MNKVDSIRIVSVVIGIVGGFIANYYSFKRQYTKDYRHLVHHGSLPLDGGRPDPIIDNRKRWLRIIGYGMVVLASVLGLFTIK